MIPSVRSALSGLLAALLAFLISPLAVQARVVMTPNGVQFAKRFEPSSASNPCYFECPTYGSDGIQPQSAAGTEQGSKTKCKYTVKNKTVTCSYDNTTGEYNGSDDECAPTAVQRGSCGGGGRGGGRGGRRRSLTRLEEVIKSRQYNPRRKSAVAQA